MAEHLKIFNTTAEYDAVVGTENEPSVSHVIESNGVEFKEVIDYSKEYLTFVAIENGEFNISKDGASYSLDGGNTWSSLAKNTNTPTVEKGKKIMWKGSMTPASFIGIGSFSSTGKFNVEGNIMSLLYGDNFNGQVSLAGKNYAFFILFYGCKKLINAKNLILPATTLSNSCYNNMFRSCENLVDIPLLPAETLADNCYGYMFDGCKSITGTPSNYLPASTLADKCYGNMFSDCYSLTTAPELKATTLKYQCYYSMFENCTSLTTAPDLNVNAIPRYGCPNMFSGCVRLNYIKCTATSVSSDYGTYEWVKNVSSSGTFVKSSSMNSWSSGINGIPNGWTIENI